MGQERLDPFLKALLEELDRSAKEYGVFRVKFSAEEERNFLRLAKDGNKRARNCLFFANIGLVIEIAQRYLNRGLSFSELIAEAWFGVMTAIENFDPALGTKFSTYAYEWVRGTIKRAVDNQGMTIRIPVYVQDRFRRAWGTARDLEREWGRQPTPKEVAEFLNEQGIDEEKVKEALDAMLFPVSFESFVWEDEDDDPKEAYWQDKGAISPEDRAIQTVMIEELSFFLERLPSKQREIICLRYFSSENRTLMFFEEIGERLGISGEWARQLHGKALQDLLQHLS